jgi:hypothetical protein
MLKVRFSENANIVVSEKNGIKNYFDLFDTQFLDIFLPSHREYIIVDENEKADICILGTQHTDNSLLREDELNIFFTVENFSVGRKHYQHFNNFNKFNNPMVKLYIYNDVTIPTNNCIPAIYQRINYFNKLNNNNIKLYYNKVRERYNELNTPFNKKKFCLFISQNGLNYNKQKILNELSSIGQIDFLMNLAEINTKLKTASCFNSFELLNTFNKYKFIICFENSKTVGYITEKIFNVFLSKSIPIYDGDPEVNKFINSKSFIPYDNNTLKKINLLMNNEVLYNNIINQEKTKELDYSFINSNFDSLLL